MTMVKRDSNSIWSLVREDRDIDDLIFAGETLNGREMSQPCSDRREAWTIWIIPIFKSRGGFPSQLPAAFLFAPKCRKPGNGKPNNLSIIWTQGVALRSEIY